MIYQQDWLMRQIEAMIQAILAVALGISANEQTATQIEDSSYGKMLASVDKGIHNKTTKYGLPTY